MSRDNIIRNKSLLYPCKISSYLKSKSIFAQDSQLISWKFFEPVFWILIFNADTLERLRITFLLFLRFRYLVLYNTKLGVENVCMNDLSNIVSANVLSSTVVLWFHWTKNGNCSAPWAKVESFGRKAFWVLLAEMGNANAC